MKYSILHILFAKDLMKESNLKCVHFLSIFKLCFQTIIRANRYQPAARKIMFN